MENMKRKKILICSHAMEIGGAEKALLGLLENIDTSRYEVDLFLLRHSGELMKYIPSDISIMPEIPQYASLAVPIKEVIKKRCFMVALGRLYGKYKAKIREKILRGPSESQIALEYSHKYTKGFMPPISNRKYDVAISFLTPHYFVAEKVCAEKKIAWIHTDYQAIKIDRESEFKMWSKFDYISAISENTKDNFVKLFPLLKSQVVLVENIMPLRYMRTLADKYTVEKEMPKDGTVRLLSIGRFSYQKRFDEVPEICKLIRKKGFSVKWYLIGFGGDEKLIRKQIKEAGMEEYVIILGKKENPYPYIKACDIYVQPSRYEGKSIAVREAQILNKPIIITDFETSRSQLQDRYDGIIVPMDIAGCAKGIAEVIKNEELQHQLIDNTKRRDYANVDAIKKVYEMIE